MDKTNCQQYHEALASSFKLIEHEGCTNHVSNILNLSNHQLSCHEIQVLSKGLNFVPTPKILKEDIANSTQQMCRKIKLQEYFRYLPRFEKLPFTGKSIFSVEDDKVDPTTVEFNNKITTEVQNLHVKKEINNLSKFEYKALLNLSKNRDIVIKKADKGSITVIMDRSTYLQEGYRQLNNSQHYRKLDQPIYIETAKKITEILRLMLHQKVIITSRQFNYLCPPDEPRPRRFYMLPKIHKPPSEWTIPNKMPKGRPIISDCNSVSEKVAEYIDNHLKLKASQHPSYIKNHV